MAQFSEFQTSIPEVDTLATNAVKKDSKDASSTATSQPQSLTEAINSALAKQDQQQKRGSTPPKAKLPKTAAGFDRLLDTIGFFGLDRASYKQFRSVLPHEQIKHDEDKNATSNNVSQFGCNVCDYRAISSEHILIHQALEHFEDFLGTLRQRANILSAKNFRFEGLKAALEPHQPSKTSEEFKLCKIIRIIGASEPKESLNEVYSKNSVPAASAGALRCAFCPEPESKIDAFWPHFVRSHPNFPFLALIISRDLAHDQEENDDGDAVKDLQVYVERFINRIGKFNQKPTLKRKREEEEEQQQQQQQQQNENAAEETVTTSSVSQELSQQSSEEASLEEPAQKRARFDLIKRAMRRSVSFVGTAAVAMGVYHLTHYLPETIQKYLE